MTRTRRDLDSPYFPPRIQYICPRARGACLCGRATGSRLAHGRLRGNAGPGQVAVAVAIEAVAQALLAAGNPYHPVSTPARAGADR